MFVDAGWKATAPRDLPLALLLRDDSQIENDNKENAQQRRCRNTHFADPVAAISGK
jgi:hypothetical protein